MGDADFGGAVFAADGADLGDQGVDFGYGAVHFDEQESAAVGIIGVNGGFGGLNGQVVHHLHGGGEHACGDDAAHGGAGFIGAVEGGQQSLHAFGTLHDAESNFRRDAQGAFGADEDSGQIVTGRVQGFRTEVS